MSKNPAQRLIEIGQSVWYDNISRDLLESGEIKRLISEWGVRGMTSNPTIFDNAISKGNSYDSKLAELKPKGLSVEAVFEELAVADIAEAADLLKPIYEESKGVDGHVSIEVSPLLATDTKGSIEEGKKLFAKLSRPNIMIKVPGTAEGIPAVKALLEEGINVNITLLFSTPNYEEVANTYIEALETRVAKGLPIDSIASVASFFVSRVDGKVDGALEKIMQAEAGSEKGKQAQALMGKFGIANSRAAYQRFLDIFGSDRFKKLAEKGAKVQRPLWASTSTKNPEYPDTLYVDELIGKDTVNTMPHNTLEAYVDHGKVEDTVTKDMNQALSMPSALKELGIEVSKILDDLQEEGVKKFSESFVQLNENLKSRLA